VIGVANTINLRQTGIRLFHGRLYNHDYLWFSSNEISKVATTQPFLHNYALCYALSQRSYRTFVGSVPRYAEDPEGEFGAMPLYATPAKTLNIERTTITFNAVDDRTLTTGDSKSSNTPNLGKRTCLNLLWERLDHPRPNLGYEVYVFTFDGYFLPGAFRLGKKGSPMRARWEELPDPVATFQEDTAQPSHVINPLDVSGQFISYEPVALPPHLLLQSVQLAYDWFVIHGNHRVHVPKRVLVRAGG
jgi:CRISPR-associated protein Csc1